ncbi:hypothetical protein [Novosphingobium sp.]|uniref:hypothetical protein n=1 Tax=Novosphingobium sp. TaxID=1874826 RepID=UPI00260BD396|nr:hypothetical protein [Novosphingobium sp.]
MATPVTTAELIAILAPHAGYKLNPPRSPEGFPRQNIAVDVFTRSEHAYDCDLRAVDETGVGIFFYNARETKAWDRVTEVRVADLDADGERVSERRFQHIGLVREIAA